MELRLAPGAEQAIQRAMAITGPDTSDLAYEAARRALEEHERRVPSGADRDAFSSHRVHHHVGTGLAR
ncbi:MAG: hypothetical protein K0S96_1131 [Geminicoccaceae bacterium]|nr:hypothetical protein [Geminicoccaceae bacterium]MDF2781327.1 hypothetical protein [Geminicoccaceae bacterium]